MSRLALPLFVLILGCGQAPPAPTAPKILVGTPAAPVLPAPPKPIRPPLELRGDVPGVMTLKDFKEKYAAQLLSPVASPAGLPESTAFVIQDAGEKKVTFAGIAASIRYSFYDDVLKTIEVNPRYATDSGAKVIVIALRDKFGTPDRDDRKNTFFLWEEGQLQLSANGGGTRLVNLDIEAREATALRERARKDL